MLSAGPREWFFIFDVTYSETPDTRLTQNILGSRAPVMWFGTPNRRGSIAFGANDEFLIQAAHFVTAQDVWTFNPAILVGIAGEDDQPFTFALAQNYPNPFSARGTFGNPATNISFSIPKAEQVTIKIYSLLGQEVATLIDQKLDAGRHAVTWNGRDRRQRPAASGVYFYQLRAGALRTVKKLLLLR